MIERVRVEIISHYTKLWKPDGTYNSFSSEDKDIGGKMVFNLRYAMSDKKAQEIIANGGVPNANTFVTMIYVDKSTGKVYDDERYGDTWFIKLQ